MSSSVQNQLKNKILEKRERIPRHIAFIMDGNGRWARKRGLPRIMGHKNGVKTVRRMVEVGPEIGVDVMTFYTFSKENWNRPHLEVSALMDLLLDSINEELDDLMKNNVALKVIGDLDYLPDAPRAAMIRGIERTSANSGLKLVLALNYSGRDEIIKAVNRIILKGMNSIDEQSFAEQLDTAGLPDPDLLIRTSGEFRLSNFLLYQMAYTEIVVTDRFWPELSVEDLFKCIDEYQNRERRFGKISDQLKT